MINDDMVFCRRRRREETSPKRKTTNMQVSKRKRKLRIGMFLKERGRRRICRSVQEKEDDEYAGQ